LTRRRIQGRKLRALILNIPWSMFPPHTCALNGFLSLWTAGLDPCSIPAVTRASSTLNQQIHPSPTSSRIFCQSVNPSRSNLRNRPAAGTEGNLLVEVAVDLLLFAGDRIYLESDLC
jgi:hypothetical protein